MRRLSISLEIAFGKDEPAEREGSADALVEMGNPHPDDSHELDGRRGPLGFHASLRSES